MPSRSLWFKKSTHIKRNILAFVTNKTEHGRNDAFQLWCCRELLRVPWTARRSNQSILKEFNSENSLEEWMLKLNLNTLADLMQRTNSLENTVMLGKIYGKKIRGWQRMRKLDSITDSMDMSSSKLWEIVKYRDPGVLQSMGSQRVGHNLATEQAVTQAVIILKTLSGTAGLVLNTQEKL